MFSNSFIFAQPDCGHASPAAVNGPVTANSYSRDDGVDTAVNGPAVPRMKLWSLHDWNEPAKMDSAKMVQNWEALTCQSMGRLESLDSFSLATLGTLLPSLQRRIYIYKMRQEIFTTNYKIR